MATKTKAAVVKKTAAPAASAEEKKIKTIIKDHAEGPEEIQNEAKQAMEDASGRGKVRHPGKWVKVTQEQLDAHHEAGRVKGYDPATKEALLNEEA